MNVKEPEVWRVMHPLPTSRRGHLMNRARHNTVGRSRSWIVLVITLAILLLAPTAFLVKVLVVDLVCVQGIAGGAIEKDLGFDVHSPWIPDGSQDVEVLAIRNVVPGGVFQRAGLRGGEVVVAIDLTDGSGRLHADMEGSGGSFITDFYRLLQRARGGGTVVLTVLAAKDKTEDAGPISRRPQRQYVFQVP